MDASQGENLMLRDVGSCFVEAPMPVNSKSKDMRLYFQFIVSV